MNLYLTTQGMLIEKHATKREVGKAMCPFILFVALILTAQPLFSQGQDTITSHPRPKIITFNPDSSTYKCLFDGIKDSVAFYSGVVTVAPGESCGTHNTEIYEEMIILLKGVCQLKITGHEDVLLNYGKIAFIPPQTEHNMVNPGPEEAKYIYIAVKSEK